MGLSEDSESDHIRYGGPLGAVICPDDDYEGWTRLVSGRRLGYRDDVPTAGIMALRQQVQRGRGTANDGRIPTSLCVS